MRLTAVYGSAGNAGPIGARRHGFDINLAPVQVDWPGSRLAAQRVTETVI